MDTPPLTPPLASIAVAGPRWSDVVRNFVDLSLSPDDPAPSGIFLSSSTPIFGRPSAPIRLDRRHPGTDGNTSNPRIMATRGCRLPSSHETSTLTHMTTDDSTTLAMNLEALVLGALRNVYDPELGLDVVELTLIRKIDLKSEPAVIKMVLTTPFCPYAASLIAEIEAAASDALERPFKVQLLAEQWDPRDAGLAW